jgi:RNA polymerase sigma-70 factor (ECF subfamily)
MSTTPQETRYTLLQRAFDLGDQAAWTQFVAHYRRFIYYILNQLGVPKNEIEDIFQKVLVTLTNSLPNYDQSKARFRTWLSSVIRNIALAHLKGEQGYQKRVGKLQDESYLVQLENTEEIEQLIDQEWAMYISSQAMMRVRKVFKGQAIEAFELGLDGLSADEISQRTGLTVASVYTLRKRVKKRLYIEILELTADLEP